MQREALSLIGLSLAPATIADLHLLLQATTGAVQSPMAIGELVDSLGSLVRRTDGGFEIFHSHFEEFVRDGIEADELSPYYHRLLGEHAESRRRVISTAYHFLRANDERAQTYLEDASAGAFIRGNWSLAREFLTERVRLTALASDPLGEARARSQLADLFREMGRFTDARSETDTAITLLTTKQLADDDEAIHLAADIELSSLLLLVHEGYPEEAVAGLHEAAEGFQGQDDWAEAVTWVNLSYAYIQLARYREGEAAAQRSLDLFTGLNDRQGIYASLTNLAACVGERGGDDEREQHAVRLIEYGREEAFPRLEAAGLNHLAIVQRRRRDYEAAEESLRQSIEIAQQLGSLRHGSNEHSESGERVQRCTSPA